MELERKIFFRKKIEKLLKKLRIRKLYVKTKKPLLGGLTSYSIIDEWKTVFFFIPKNGNTSLKEAFYKAFIGKNPNKQIHSLFPRSKRNPDIKDYFKFAFVRNPYDRVVSCYKDKVAGDKNKFLENFRKIGISPQISFKEFVRKISGIPDKKADRHLASQSYLLSNKKKKLVPDFIGRFENIEWDYKKVCKKIGIENPLELPKKNPSKRKKDYKDYYDEETKKLVQKRYKKDFELFGYSKEF